MIEGFEERDVATPRGDVHVAIGGDGPPLLALHGFPQNHRMWHACGPLLAERFTVVAADLPGYGASFRPAAADDHEPHGKRALAADLVAAMAALGHERFAVAGHDRGARVAYRMALDHPDVVTRLAVMDVVPTKAVWDNADTRFAIGYWHWPFLAQPAPLPEDLILGSPDGFWEAARRMGIGGVPERYPDDVVESYRAAFRDPGAVQAMCEDYRAGATVDVAHDAEGATIACPTLVLWGARGALPVFYDDVVAVWRPWAPDVRGHAVDASHFLVEDEPEATAAALTDFLADA